ncbi:MAG: TonB-dependent receptor [Pseudomonadales bacterium]|nr:TonB-dependent receptor [Pseudomonadales bacterium]
MIRSYTQMMNTMMCTLVLHIAIGLFFAGLHFPNALFASEVEYMEEVVVTARKRQELNQDVPISIQAISGAKIEHNHIQNLEELSLYTPNLHIGQAGIGDQLFIRGIGSGVNQGFEQSVGSFIDGVYFGRGRSARNGLFDIQQVEIIKGPQSILFGKNTIAGAINIQSARPSDDWMNSIKVFYENETAEKSVAFISSGPLNDSLNMRISMKASQLDGWLENPNKSNEPAFEDYLLRFSLSGVLNESLSFYSKIETSQHDVEGRASQLLKCSAQLQSILDLNGLFDDCKNNDIKYAAGKLQTSLDGLSSFDFNQEQAVTDADNALFTLIWDKEAFTITSTTGYLAYTHKEFTDGDYSPLSVLAVQLDEDFEQLSQEIRFTSFSDAGLQHTAGVYVQRSEAEFSGAAHIALYQVPDPRLPPTSFAGSRPTSFQQTEESFAIFYQALWDINLAWELTLGLRYTNDSKDVRKRQLLAELNQLTASDNPVIIGVFNTLLNSFAHDLTGERKDENISPNLTLSWQVSDDGMLYFSASQGFKAGGFDAVLGNGDPNSFEFESETVNALEIGHKAMIADGQASLNIALFYNQFDDVQISTFDGSLGFLVNNAGAITNRGVEVDSRWAITDTLKLYTALAYLDSFYTDYPDAQCYAGQTPAQGCIDGLQNLKDKPTQFSPTWQANISLEYLRRLSALLSLNSVVDLRYVDDFLIANDGDPNLIQDGYAKMNIAFNLIPVNEQWLLQLMFKNISNEQTSNWGNDVALFTGSYFIHNEKPRTVSLAYQYNF